MLSGRVAELRLLRLPHRYSATWVAEPPPTHAIAIGRGTKHLDGDVDIIVPPSKQTLPDHAFSRRAKQTGGAGMPAMTVLAKPRLWSAVEDSSWGRCGSPRLASCGLTSERHGTTTRRRASAASRTASGTAWRSYSADPVAAIALGSPLRRHCQTVHRRPTGSAWQNAPAGRSGARLKIGFCNLDFPPAGTYFRGTGISRLEARDRSGEGAAGGKGQPRQPRGMCPARCAPRSSNSMRCGSPASSSSTVCMPRVHDLFDFGCNTATATCGACGMRAAN